MDLSLALDKHSATETGRKLRKILTDIWDNPNFVLGILVYLKTDEQRKKMIKALENNLEDYEFDDDDWNEYTDKVYLIAEAIEDGDI